MHSFYFTNKFHEKFTIQNIIFKSENSKMARSIDDSLQNEVYKFASGLMKTDALPALPSAAMAMKRNMYCTTVRSPVMSAACWIVPHLSNICMQD